MSPQDDPFDRSLHRVSERYCCDQQCNEGKDCPESRRISVAALRGLWRMARNAVRSLTVSDWLAIACVVAAVASVWSH